MREEPEQTSLPALKVDSPTGSHTYLIRKAARSGPETILTSDRKLFAGHLMGHALAQRKGQLENKVDLRRITPTYIRALLGLVYNECASRVTCSEGHPPYVYPDPRTHCACNACSTADTVRCVSMPIYICIRPPQQPPLDYNYIYF